MSGIVSRDDADCGGHPLYVTWTNKASAPGGIAVFNLALIDDGHRFKTAMGMAANAARG